MLIYLDSDKHKHETRKEMLGHVYESLERILLTAEERGFTVAIERDQSIAVKREDLLSLLGSIDKQEQEYRE
jgi:hypothetical protein